MAIVITKKTRTILLIILGVLVLGGGGYLLWRVNQPETVAPEDSEAASCKQVSSYGGKLAVCSGNSYVMQQIDGSYKFVSHPEWDSKCGNPYNPNNTYDEPYGTCAGKYGSIGPGCYTKCTTPPPPPPPPPKPPDYCIAEYPAYNSMPYTTPAASKKSELILYYQVIPPYTGLAQFIIKDPDGQDHTIKPSSSQERVATGIVLEAGETATVKTVYESSGGGLAIGWQSVNSDNTCGSGAMGPIQNNDCKRYEKKDVSGYISWANSSGDETLISRQCWADAKEWEGDYDFEDFFVQFSYLPIIAEPTNLCGNGIIDNGEDCDTGITGENGQCQGDGETVACPNTCVCPVVNQTNPDWTIVKDVKSEYIVINGENYASIDYTIDITNIGDGEGSIDRIVDELDDKVIKEYIQEISNNGVYASSSITWDLEGVDEVFSPQENLELIYSFRIPESAYGTYRNIVTAYPTEGDNFSDNATLTLVAKGESQTVPQTGIFDTVIGRISLGFSFIFLGGLISQNSRINYLFNSVSERNRFKKDIRKERRNMKRREKLERRFK